MAAVLEDVRKILNRKYIYIHIKYIRNIHTFTVPIIGHARVCLLYLYCYWLKRYDLGRIDSVYKPVSEIVCANVRERAARIRFLRI